MALSALTVWLRMLLIPALGHETAFVTTIFAVILTACFAGTGATLLAVALSGVGTYLLVMEPHSATRMDHARHAWSLASYLTAGSSFAFLVWRFRRAQDRADEAARVARAALDDRDEELAQRRAAEQALRDANADLERNIRQRTEELTRSSSLLETAHAQLVSALAVGGMGTWSVDVATSRVGWDENNARMWGYGDQGTDPWDLDLLPDRIHEADRARVIERLNALIRDGGTLNAEFRIRRPDGEVRWLSSTGSVLRGTDGRVVTATGVTTDITDHKREIEAQTRAQKLEALGTLAGGIAHDFNNILMSIDGNADLATGKLPADHPAQHNLAEIRKATTRAGEITRRILAFSRHGAARREVVPLATVAADALELLRAALPAGLKLRADLPDDAPWVVADASQIHQAVVNLVTNAARAVDENGRVDVRIRLAHLGPGRAPAVAALPEGSYAVLEVHDNGCGIAPDVIPRIFDPFFTTHPHGEGTGLGLWVVQGIARSQGGEVTVESTPGHGSTFRVFLPAAETRPSDKGAETAARCRGSGERVLLVDDEEAIVGMMGTGLEDRDFRMTVRTLPEHALRDFLLAPHQFDALVTDLSMPNISGLEMTRHVLEERPDLPVILLSGYLKPDVQQRAMELGVREILQKPASIDEVACALRRALGGPRPACEPRE